MNAEEPYVAIARALKALANPTRLRIVRVLADRELCLCQLQPSFNLDKSTLSRHVAALISAGIVSQRRDGTRVFLRLSTLCILSIFSCMASVLRAEARSKARLAKATEKIK